MESLKNLNIQIKSGQVPSNPGLEFEAFLGISQEHVNHVKSLYQGLTHEEIQDFVPTLVFDCKSPESSQKVAELFQGLIDGFFPNENEQEPEFFLFDKFLRIFAKSEDEEYQRSPKFVPKVFKNEKSVIIRLVPVNSLKELVQTKFEIYSEDLSEEVNKPQEIKLEFQTDKQCAELLKPEKFTSEISESFLLKLTMKISKNLRSQILPILRKRNRKLGALLSFAELMNHFNLELNLSDLKDHINPESDPEAFSQLCRLFKEIEEMALKNVPTRRLYNSRRSRFLRVIDEHASHQFRAFVVAPHAAVFVRVSIPEYFKYLMREANDD